MEVVDLLGNHRKTGQHFATGASNKLCGQHTLEICYIDCAVTSHGLQIPLSSSVKKIIQSYCIVMVTEDDLQLVPVANSHQVDIVRAFSQGLKYAIKFKKMSDIAFLKGEDSELVLSKVAKAGTDPRPRSILIRLLDESTCKIDTNGCGSSRLLKQIQSAWQSSLVLRSAQLSRLNTTADVTMADEYLSVTINSLKLCSASHTSNIDRGSDQQLEIFNEFANEAWVDLELKERTCRSREFFVFTLIFCIELVQLPSPRASAISDRKAWTVNQSIDDANRCSRSDIRMKQSSSRNLFIDKINGIESNSELQTRLHAIALQRLNLIRAALKAIAGVLFSSETSPSRNGLLGGPHPLTLDAWCPLLGSDLYVEICKNIGCVSDTDEEQIQDALKQCHLFHPKTIKSRTQTRSEELKDLYDSNGNFGSRSPAVSSLWKQFTGDLVSEAILTPVKEKKRIKKVEIDFLAPTLADTRRGVKDLQIIISLELARITAIGYSRNMLLTRNPEVRTAPSTVLLYGEIFARQTNWEQSLDDLLMRVSTLLDDMLCSAVIQLKILDVSMASRRGSAQLSGRSIDTVAFERRASKLLIRNKDRFRDFSPAVTSRPSKMSPGLNTPKGEDWPTMTPIKSGALSERDERTPGLYLVLPDSLEGTSRGTPHHGPRTPMSASFDFGVDIASLSSRRATVPPSPAPTPKHSARGKERDRDREDGIHHPPRSRKSVVNFHWTEEEAERDKIESRCPLETQEILLFYTLALLQTMALDSAKIRKCLGQDLSSYWLPIMQIFNTICPRPPLHEDRGLTVDSKREETEKVLSNDNRTTSGIFSKKSSGQDPNISQHNLQEKKSFLGFFRSKAPIDIPNEEILETDRSDIPIISKISANSGNNLRLKSESKMEDTCDLLLSDYGPPQYGMSFASWTLLVMARRYAEEMVIMFGLHDRNQMRVNGEPMREYVPFRFEKLTAMQVKKLNKEKADAEIAIMNKPITERVDKVFMNRFEEGDGDDSRLVRTRHRDGSGAINKGSTQNNTPVACPSLPVSDVNYHDSSSLGPVSRRSRTVFRRARQSATESDTEIIEKPVSPKDIPKGIITSRDLPVRNNVDSPRLNVPTISSEINSKSKLNSGNGNDNDNEETATDENGNCGKYGFRTHSTYVSS